MRALVISDIHGIKTNLPKIRNRYMEFKCEKLIVLGDLYWSNYDVDYDPNYVREFLASFKDFLICMRGNCDFRVNFDSELYNIEMDKVINIGDNLYITHGDTYNERNWIIRNSVLIFGHYHIAFIKEEGTNVFINPGSISKPRGDDLASYLLINEDEFTIFDVNDRILFTKKVNLS